MIYKIVFAPKASDFEIMVNKYLADGWEPQGGVAVHPINHQLIQALTKSDEETRPNEFQTNKKRSST